MSRSHTPTTSQASTPTVAPDTGSTDAPAHDNSAAQAGLPASEPASTTPTLDAAAATSEAGSSWWDDAAGWAGSLTAEAVGSVAELLAWLDTLGKAAAKGVFERLTTVQPDLVTQFVQQHPMHPFGGMALAMLPRPRAVTILQGVSATAGSVLLATAPTWATPTMAALLAALPVARAIEILSTMDAAHREQLLLEAMGWLQGQLAEALDSYWAQGVGVKFGGDLAVTFGVPVKGGASAFFQIANAGKGVVKAKGGGDALVAGATGVGAGASAGLAQKKGNEPGIGVGADAGLEGELGVKAIMEQEYEFDLFSGSEFVDLYDAIVTGQDMRSTAERFANLLARLDTDQYIRKTKLSMKPYAEGSASGDAGVRTGTENTAESYNTRDNPDADAGETTEWWQELTRAAAQATLSVDAEIGVEMDTPKWERIHDKLVPSEMEVAFFGQAGALLEMSDQLPWIPSLMPPDIGAEAGAKVKFKGKPAAGSFELTDPTWEAYYKARVEDVESQLSLGFDDYPNPYTDSWQEYLDNLGDAEVAFKLNIGSAILERFVSAALIHANLSDYASMLAEGSVELKSKLPEEAVQSIFVTLLGQEDDDNAALHVTQALQQFLATRDVTPIADALSLVVEAVHDGVQEMKLEMAIGGRLGGSAGVSGGAKAELDGGVSGALTFERDLIAAYDEAPTIEEIRNLLMGVGTDGRAIIDLSRYVA